MFLLLHEDLGSDSYRPRTHDGHLYNGCNTRSKGPTGDGGDGDKANWLQEGLCGFQ